MDVLRSVLLLLSYLMVVSNGDKPSGKRRDFFTALVDMKPLVELEHRLTTPFLDLIKAQEEKLDKLESTVDKIRSATDGKGDTLRYLTDFLGNPIHSIKLIQRATEFWPKVVKEFVTDNPAIGKLLLTTVLSCFQVICKGVLHSSGSFRGITCSPVSLRKSPFS